MKLKPIFLIPALLVLFLSGCQTTFFGTVLVLRFQDIMTYVGIALGLSIVASFLTRGSARTTFWVCFILSLALTPLAGLIYCLILVTKNEN